MFALVAVAIPGRGGNKYNGDTLFRFDLQIIACTVLLLPVANYYSHLGDNNVSSSICWRMRAIWLKMHVFLASGSRCFTGGPNNSLVLHSDSSRKPPGLILLYVYLICCEGRSTVSSFSCMPLHCSISKNYQSYISLGDITDGRGYFCFFWGFLLINHAKKGKECKTEGWSILCYLSPVQTGNSQEQRRYHHTLVGKLANLLYLKVTGNPSRADKITEWKAIWKFLLRDVFHCWNVGWKSCVWKSWWAGCSGPSTGAIQLTTWRATAASRGDRWKLKAGFVFLVGSWAKRDQKRRDTSVWTRWGKMCSDMHWLS